MRRALMMRRAFAPEPIEESNEDRADRLERDALHLIDALKDPAETVARIERMLDEAKRLRGTNREEAA
jgi:hypothetical protein